VSSILIGRSITANSQQHYSSIPLGRPSRLLLVIALRVGNLTSKTDRKNQHPPPLYTPSERLKVVFSLRVVMPTNNNESVRATRQGDFLRPPQE
jgi:hypothetical protein